MYKGLLRILYTKSHSISQNVTVIIVLSFRFSPCTSRNAVFAGFFFLQSKNNNSNNNNKPQSGCSQEILRIWVTFPKWSRAKSILPKNLDKKQQQNTSCFKCFQPHFLYFLEEIRVMKSRAGFLFFVFTRTTWVLIKSSPVTKMCKVTV